jgi:hypothetical protein
LYWKVTKHFVFVELGNFSNFSSTLAAVIAQVIFLSSPGDISAMLVATRGVNLIGLQNAKQRTEDGTTRLRFQEEDDKEEEINSFRMEETKTEPAEIPHEVDNGDVDSLVRVRLEE